PCSLVTNNPEGWMQKAVPEAWLGRTSTKAVAALPRLTTSARVGVSGAATEATSALSRPDSAMRWSQVRRDIEDSLEAPAGRRSAVMALNGPRGSGHRAGHPPLTTPAPRRLPSPHPGRKKIPSPLGAAGGEEQQAGQALQ